MAATYIKLLGRYLECHKLSEGFITSLLIKVFKAFDNQDIHTLANPTNEDFVQVDYYEMASREDWLEKLRVLFESGNIPDFTRARTVIADQ